jgi:hypothetical protein
VQSGRRTLDFHDLDAVVSEVKRLDEGGYTQIGKWNLAQICLHLEDWLRYPLDGFPRPPLPVALMMGALRHTLGRSMLRKALVTRAMPPNAPTAPQTVHAAGEASDSVAVARLTETIRRFQAYTGPLHPSPLFGPLDRDTSLQLQIIHCMHHLSFLIPRNSANPDTSA